MQLDLLSTELPKGFKYFPEFISPEEEKFLLSFAEQLPWEEFRMHGVVARRKMYRYGVSYSTEGKNAPARNIPDEIAFLIRKGAEALKISSKEIIQVLFNHYPVGAPIGWHRDAPTFEKIVGVSLKSSCRMKLKPYDSKLSPAQILLAPRSGYYMTGESRWNWEHHIPPVKEERYSITMRTLKL